jgi:hypothetical protein
MPPYMIEMKGFRRDFDPGLAAAIA